MTLAAGSRQQAGRLAVAVIATLLLDVTSRAQDPPLPEAAALFAAARENIARAGRVQDQFAYKERRTELHRNPFGKLGTDGTVLFEVTPLDPGPGFTRKLLARDGVPVVNGEVERIEQRRRRDRAQSPSAIEDVVSTLDFAVDRRVMVEGTPAIVVTFSPKRDSSPATREGKMARSFTGTIWIDEAQREVMRVEATAVESISYGYGLVARLGKGTTVSLLREPVEPDLWLPTSIRFKGQGRALLLRRLNVDFGVDWFDYKKIAR